jgi:hypothetical protein
MQITCPEIDLWEREIFSTIDAPYDIPYFRDETEKEYSPFWKEVDLEKLERM